MKTAHIIHLAPEIHIITYLLISRCHMFIITLSTFIYTYTFILIFYILYT